MNLFKNKETNINIKREKTQLNKTINTFIIVNNQNQIVLLQNNSTLNYNSTSNIKSTSELEFNNSNNNSDNEQKIPTTLIYSKRKNVSIIIDKNAELILRLPLKITMSEINSIIQEKKKWIIEKIILVSEKNKNKIDRFFGDGGKFMFLGKLHKLNYSEKLKFAVYFDGNEFYTFLKEDTEIKSHLEKWYKKNAKKILTNRTIYFSNLYGFEFKQVKINSATSRWGSCSWDNNINYSWKLIQAPIFVIDYVVIHELVHTKIKNHSKEFWDKVSQCYPNYLKAVNWLKDNNFIIEFD